MPFSRSQHITHFQPMVNKAWRAHCYRECITEGTDASKRAWYEKLLFQKFKVASTTLLNNRDDFENAMALFEEISGDGTYWQLQALKGDAMRALHNLEETIKLLRLTPEYIAGIHRRMGFRNTIYQMDADALIKLRLALLYHVRREQNRLVEDELKPKGLSAPPG